MIARLRRFVAGSLRRQLIAGVAGVFILLTGLFVYDQTQRQRDGLMKQAASEAQGLAQTLAVNSTAWILSNDLQGMEELTHALAAYPDLRYVMLITPQGQVLAHSDRRLVGRRLADAVSRDLLDGPTEAQLLVRSERLMDAAAPILANGRLVGWARVGIDQTELQAGLNTLKTQGLLYALASILLGTLLAWLLGQRLTRGLNELALAAHRLGQGERHVRVPRDEGDEVGIMARAFNIMAHKLDENLDTLQRQNAELTALKHALDQHAIVSTTDTEGVITSVNDGFCSVSQFSREELLGQTHRLIKSGAHDDEYYRQLWATIRNGRTWHGILQNRRKDGQPFWAQTTIVPILDGSGHPTQYIGVRTDITGLKHAEAALAEGREQLRAIQDSVRDGIVTIDTQGRIQTFNAAAEALFGYRPYEVLGQNVSQLMPEPYRSQHDGYLKRYLDSGVARVIGRGSVEVLARRKDGSTFPVELSLSEMRLEQHLGFTGVIRDIAARKQAEATTQRARRALQTLSACNAAMIDASDEASLYEAICRVIVEVGGYRFTWVGRIEHDADQSIRPIASAGVEEGYLEKIRLSWADTERGQGPGGIAARTGQVALIRDVRTDPRFQPWLEDALKRGYGSVLGLPLRSAEGCFGVLLIYAHETDAFDDEEVGLLRELSENLAYGITSLRARAEHERLQRQLQQTQKLEAIGQLTGGIAHDFNNILGAILGYTNLALERCVPDKESKLAEYLGQVQRASERARDLVAKMLTFARGGTGEALPLDMQPLVKEVAKMLASTLPSSIELTVHAEAQLPPVRMDPVQLHQIVTNLCVNARDAIGAHGRIEIVLRLAHEAGTPCTACHSPIQGDYVELSVRDDGAGIAPDALSRIFDPFYTTKAVGKGTGMGLAVVLGIVHDSGGHLVVQSQPGQGSRFRLLFPPCADVADARSVPTQGASGLAPHTSDKRIMVVDDEESLALLTREVLDGHGYAVSLHYRPEQALEAFKADPRGFDALITDQTMPGMSGIELAHHVLAIRPELPVLMCSGYSDEVDAETAKRHGIRAFFNKPVDAEALLAELRGQLGQ